MTMLDLANDLLDRVLLSSGEGDWTPYFLRSEHTWSAGQTAAFKLVFNVPADADLHAELLNLYLQYRVVNTVTPTQSDVTFRPCNWSCVSAVDAANPLREANATVFERRDGANLQSNPVDIASYYSTPYGLNDGNRGMPITVYVSGKDQEDLIIARGSSLELDVSPIFSSATQILTGLSADFAAELRVIGVLQGRKNVRAFR